jgi:FKBP-type peptidyl-prolyl cis-trans isomerase FkpA
MKKNLKIVLSVAVVFWASAISTSCSNHDDTFDVVKQLNNEVITIDNYIANAFLPAIKDPTGIRIVINRLGTGLPALLDQTVDVDYKGTLLSDNSVFDQGNAKGPLNTFISGWQIALSMLPVGTQATIFVPSGYAYGNAAQPNIPANSTLVFDLTFNSVTPTTAEAQQFGADTVAIDNYLKSKNIAVTKDKSGIRYAFNSIGTGAQPTLFDKLKLTYTFRLVSDDGSSIGTFTQQPTDTYFNRPADYILGMMVGLQKLPVGTKATLYIPSTLGFGATDKRDSGGILLIPANSNLIVEVELTAIVD